MRVVCVVSLLWMCGFGGPPAFGQGSSTGEANLGQPADQATMGTDGKRLQFQFSGAAWLEVLQWFADEADLNLDWRELPEGSLNLTTQQSYNVSDALGVINRHLASRGFTLLRSSDVLFLVKLDSPLNPSMVPRVSPDELDQRSSYELVKSSFSLDWMLAETAVEEFKPILSPYGIISSFSATNRIEVIDFVENLLEIREILGREESNQSQARLVAEFRLEHANAIEVVDDLRELMGLTIPLPRSASIMMQIRNSQRGRDRDRDRDDDDRSGQPQTDPAASSVVYLVANERQNSIVANGPPDKIALVRQAVSALDVPSSDVGMMLSDETVMKVYPLNGVDPDALEDIFEDLRNIGKLHQDSVFSEDDDTQILFAYASIKDHMTIRSVMDQLAKASRTFHVIPLNRLNADAVVAAITELMNGESGGQDRSRRDRNRQQGGDWGGFRVEADTVNSRLLLFATGSELNQVKELLLNIGEREQVGNIRVIDAGTPQSIANAVKQLRQIWPDESPNRLDIDIDPAAEPTRESSRAIKKLPVPQAIELDPADEALRRNWKLDEANNLGDSSEIQWVHQLPPSSSGERSGISLSREQTPMGPEVTIRRGADGQIILRSDDADALGEAEQLLRALLPPKQRYRVIHMKHQIPVAIEAKLMQALDQGVVPTSGPVSFISDAVTDSLLVVGANEKEFDQLSELADFFDQPNEANPESVRRPQMFKLNYIQADQAATILKDLYRDLLSPADPALSQNRTSRNRGDGSDRGADRSLTQAPYMGTETSKATFKGLLSVSVLAESNTVAVSAPAFMMAEIEETIRSLDTDQAETVVEVISVDGIDAAMLSEALGTAIGITSGRTGQNGNRSRTSSRTSNDPRANRQRDRN
ncbi:Bacterial type II/III secretion system short domain protein [Novipirellula aureliae]|uniref:Bacterial type II/III secretion system short domain protein n=2 Tax=Novipirellula aureliae TaxID=2527966 RepID=A0A5C6EBZ2_9BACT|nr:Bacterial type II/III secretion system short domain protein [Novipirellula aureliae]